MKFQTYSKYKKAGFKWIEKLPSEWDIVPTRSLMKPKKERVGAMASDYVLLSLTLSGVIPRDMEGSGKHPAEYDTYQPVYPNDLLMCLFDYDVTPRTVGYVAEKGMVTSAYTRLVPKSTAYAKYYYYYYLWLDNGKELLHLCTGLRHIVSKHIFWSLLNPQPPLETQKRIANFLDEKTKIIDDLVTKKEKMIELLLEKRSSLITRAVTKGLDPNTKMKPSGIDWLGDIPAGWSVRKIKYLIKHNDGGVWGEFDNPEGTPVLRSTEVSVDGTWRIDPVELAYRELSLAEIKKGRLKKGDLLVTKSSGSEEHIGKTAIADEVIERGVYCYSNFMQRLRVKTEINPKILYYFLNSRAAREQYRYFSTSTTGLGNLTATILNSLFYLLIPTAEQEVIVMYLDRKVDEINHGLLVIESQIKKLKEYRSSLIYSAVTGKIKV